MAEQRLDIIIEAKNRVERGLRRIGRSLANFAKRVAQVGVVATAAISASIIEIGRRGAQAVDELAKLARQTSENINTINALRGVFVEAGGSAGQFATAVRGLQRRLGDAERGTGSAVGALEELGLRIENLRGLDLQGQLELIADRMQRVDSHARRTSIAMELAGRGGASLLTILEDGGDALREATRDVSRFQIALDQASAEGVERANDAIARLGGTIRQLGMVIAIEMADNIAQAATRSAEAIIRQANRLGRALARPFNAMLFAVNEAFGQAEGRAGDFFDGLVGKIDAVSQRIGEFIATLPARIESVMLRIEAFFTRFIGELNESIAALPRALVGQDTIRRAEQRVEAAASRLDELLGARVHPGGISPEELERRFKEEIPAHARGLLSPATMTPELMRSMLGISDDLLRGERTGGGLVEQAASRIQDAAERFRQAEIERAHRMAEAERERGKRLDSERERERPAGRPLLQRLAQAIGERAGNVLDNLQAMARRGGPPAPGSATAPELIRDRLITGAGAARQDVDRQQLEQQRELNRKVDRADEKLAQLRDLFNELVGGGGRAVIGGLLPE